MQKTQFFVAVVKKCRQQEKQKLLEEHISHTKKLEEAHSNTHTHIASILVGQTGALLRVPSIKSIILI